MVVAILTYTLQHSVAFLKAKTALAKKAKKLL
jgi:hypothetical protein